MYYVILIDTRGGKPYVYGPFSLEEAKEERSKREEVHGKMGYDVKVVKEVDKVE